MSSDLLPRLFVVVGVVLLAILADCKQLKKIPDYDLLLYFIVTNLHGIADVGQLCASEGSLVAVPRRICKKYTIILQGAA